MMGLIAAGVFLALLGLGFGFLQKQDGPRIPTNRGREGGE